MNFGLLTFVVSLFFEEVNSLMKPNEGAITTSIETLFLTMEG
jgi:hypothetical protein